MGLGGFDPDNVELVVKVLDGRRINGRYWVFFGSPTDVAFDLVVTDTLSGIRRSYRNLNFASFGDTEAFSP